MQVDYTIKLWKKSEYDEAGAYHPSNTFLKAGLIGILPFPLYLGDRTLTMEMRLYCVKWILGLLLMHCFLNGFAQQEIIEWPLKYGNKVRFESGGIISSPTGPADISKGSASLCDANGALLMVTDGNKILDRNYNEMPGQDQLLLLTESLTPVFIKVPGKSTQYYLFYNHCSSWYFDSPYDLYFATIDLSLNGGKGAVTSVDNKVATGLSRGYTLVKKSTAEDFWIVTHQYRTRNFSSYLVNNSGINTSPVLSTVGLNGTATEYFFMDLRTSPNGKMIGGFTYTNYTTDFAENYIFVEVFNMAEATGKLTEKIKSTRMFWYFIQRASVEFSPDSRLLYAECSYEASGLQLPSSFSSIWQYNLCYTDSVSFSQNAPFPSQWVATGVFLSTFGRLQLGPDKKLYYPHSGTSGLWRFEYPNELGSSSMPTMNAVPLASPGGLVSPSFYHHLVNKAVGSNIIYTGSCYPQPYHFSITNDTIANVQWDFGDPSSGSNTVSQLKADHSFSKPGFYTVSARIYDGSNKLVETISRKLEVTDPAKRLLWEYPKDTVVCYGSTVKLQLKGQNALFYWSVRYDNQPDNVYRAELSDSIRLTESGMYYVHMIQNSCQDCERIDSIRFTALPSPYVGLGNDKNLCAGDSLLLDIFEQQNATYKWSTGENTHGITIKTSGKYWVEAEFNHNGCPVSDTILVTDAPGLQLKLPMDTVLCNSATLLLEAKNPNAYNVWQDGSTGENFLVDKSGKFWVTVYSNFGCTKTDTVLVSVTNAAAVDLGADTSLCKGDSLILSNNIPGTTTLWSNGSTDKQIIVKTTGSFWVQVDNGNCKVKDEIKVTFTEPPGMDLGNDIEACEGLDVQLKPVSGATDFLWQDGSNAASFEVNAPGIYWAEAILNGCKNRDSIIVNYLAAPVVNLGSDTSICRGTPVSLNASNPSASSYLWNNGSSSPVLMVSQAGQYIVEVTGVNNCKKSDTIFVRELLLPGFSLGPDTTICEGQELPIDIPITGAEYLWNTGSTQSGLTLKEPGLYWLNVSSQGCSFRDSLLLKVNAYPIVDIGRDTSICEESAYTLEAYNPGASYVWQDQSTASAFNVRSAGRYAVSVSLNGCSVSRSVNIGILQKPDFRFENDSLLCKGLELELRTSSREGNFTWSDGSSGNSLSVRSPGMYTLTVSNGCGSKSLSLTVREGLCTLLMPNAFSPNADGKNDIFRLPFPQFISKCNLTLYNRFGQKVFESNDPTKGWDGKSGGIAQPEGNYTYILKVTTKDGLEQTLKGFTLLLR